MQFHKPILTQQTKVPLSWIILVNFLWFAGLYSIFVLGTGLPITLARHTDDTRIISVLVSMGAILGIVLGPVCNFLSDRLWSRWGRRRPFMIVATLGTFVATLLIPFAPSLLPIALLIIISSILGDIGVTGEPLWLEVIPEKQRGIGIAVRTIMISMASLFFFQIMFSQWDSRYFFSLPMPGGGVWEFNFSGEDWAYFSCAAIKFVLLLIFCFMMREVKPAGGDLKPITELNINPFVFFKELLINVFGDKRWWIIYLYYCIPMLLPMGWAFVMLMITVQWNYPKDGLAILGLPTTLLSIFIFAPIMGRQADTYRVYPRWLLILPIFALPTLIAYLVREHCLGLDFTILPPLWVMMIIMTSAAFTTMAFAFLLTQEFNRRAVPRGQNKRLWPWYLNLVFQAFWTFAKMIIICFVFKDAPPPISYWFFLTVVDFSIGAAFFGTLAAPLLYEYMPLDKIGTISSGFGLFGSAVSSVATIVVGWWIFYYSKFFVETGEKDYSSGLLLSFVTCPLLIILATYFFLKAKSGNIKEYGRLRLNSDGSSVDAKQ